ncbi:MAG: shikimate kinase [Micrococcales bacterium]
MTDTKPIVLVGPAGVGKTTVGKKLASALGLPFTDTDSLFVRDHGAIADFFQANGEAAFRKLEEDYFAHALTQHGVISTGGGVVLSPANQIAMKVATVIYLATDGTHMLKRISQGNRPLIKNGISDWKKLYEERKPLYEKVANITIDCSGHPIKQTIAKIKDELEKRG